MNGHLSHLECMVPVNAADVENLMTTTLQPYLEKMVRQRKKLEDESMKYEELRNNICMLRDNGVAEFKSLVNVGRDFFVQARVQQSEMLVVVLGAGVSMELSREEVLLFVDAKQRALHRSLESCAQACAQISQHCRQFAHHGGGA